jgi:adenylate cyclase
VTRTLGRLHRSGGRRRVRTLLFLGVGLAVAGLALAGSRAHVLRGLELGSVDVRFAVRGDRTPPPNVVLVEIDDEALNGLGLRWPFPRSVHAKLVDRLREAGAKVIAYDIVFSAPTKGHEEQDDALIRAVTRAHNVVLATDATDGHGGTPVFGGADLRKFGARAGFSLLPPDPDGVLRRTEYESGGVDAFAVAAAERYLGRRLPASALRGTTSWIDYAGREGTIQSVPFAQALRGQVPPGFFRGKIVVVGMTAPALQDVHAASTSPAMSGPEIQANAIATALAGFPLRSVSTGWNVLLVVALGLLPAIVSLRARPLPTLAAAVAGGCAFAVGAQLAFDHGRIVTVVYPLGALALAAVGSLGVHYLLEAFERQRTHDLFSRFVPEEVVNQVLAKADAGLRLGGVRATGTCIFTDLRDSTAFAESLPPEEVVDVVNRYLGELSEAILGHGGTLISYLGDGFMAIFGAPIEQSDHADRALDAAREILDERLPRFNAWCRERGLGDGFRMGIGINSGPFLAGNVGSERRLEYTAMGDTINTASRLEGLTKGSGHSVFMAEATREALTRPAPDLVFVGEREVRGRAGTINIWSLPPVPEARAAAATSHRGPVAQPALGRALPATG